MEKSQIIFVAFAGSNENLLMAAVHLCCLDYISLDLFGWEGFLSPLKILLRLCTLAVPQVQAVAAAHCPSEQTKLDDPTKTKENIVWIL